MLHETAIAPTAIALARVEIAPVSCHCRSTGPNRRCESSFSASFGELRVKNHSAAIMKQVVGNTGRTAPAVPRPTQIQPPAA
jgi:hypothetical protein